MYMLTTLLLSGLIFSNWVTIFTKCTHQLHGPAIPCWRISQHILTCRHRDPTWSHFCLSPASSCACSYYVATVQYALDVPHAHFNLSRTLNVISEWSFFSVRNRTSLELTSCIKCTSLLPLKLTPLTEKLTSHTMPSSTPSDPGDAVWPDGTLKDASKMMWSYDADDSIPFPTDTAVGSDPATGLRQTSHISHPSQYVLKEYELASGAAASTHPATKCKASHNLNTITCYVLKKVCIDVDNNDDKDGNPSSNNGSAATEPVTEPMSDDYKALKAMANADNMVHSLSPLSFVLYPHLCLRLRPSKLGRSVVQISLLYFSMRKDTFIPLQERSWMGTGAQFASKCFFPIYHFILLIAVTWRNDTSVKQPRVSWLEVPLPYTCTLQGIMWRCITTGA